MTEQFYIGQTFETEYPPEAAIWCNENNAQIILNKSNKYEIFEVKQHIETVQEKIIRLELEYQMNRWQREAILAENSPYSEYTKQKAQELEDLAKELRK